jgi:putative membrane protein
MSRALHFFVHAEKERIKEATQAAESKTIGEIAVMVVDASTRYREAEVLGAITAGSIVAFIVTIFLLHESIWWYIPLVLVFFIASWLFLKKMPSVTIHFTGARRRQQAVRDRAMRAFYEKGLYRTKGSTGVLFFISLLERKVWVLADRGIHDKMTQAKLNAFARNISTGIRDGAAADALVRAIGETGELLAEHFPVRDDDINELADTVLTGGSDE